MNKKETCFSFVASQNPNLDASQAELLQHLGNIFLQLVLYSGGANELQVVLNDLVGLLQLLVAQHNVIVRLVKQPLYARVAFLADQLVGKC